MAMKIPPALALFWLVALAGCCGPTGPSSCTTYGEACTEFCDKARGTQFDYGTNCFSECMSEVKMQGLGDATTCCARTQMEECESACNSQASRLASQYGISQDEQDEIIYECMGECTGMYQALGMSLDSCALVAVSQFDYSSQ